MAYTDREIRKLQEAGQLTTGNAASGLTGSAATEVAKIHSRHHHFMKTGAENATTNVAETLAFNVRLKSKLSSLHYLTGTNVAADGTNYAVITAYKRTAGGSAVAIASYNTHTNAQGAITLNVPAAFSVVANSDSTLAAGDTVHYAIVKSGAGGATVAIGTFSFLFEEV